MDYCTARRTRAAGSSPTRGSGGTIVNGSQQQWLTRNSTHRRLVERRLEPGVLGRRRRAGAVLPRAATPYTTIPTSPVTREAPYLYADASGNWRSSCLRCRRTAQGTSWVAGPRPAGRSRSSQFYVANPADNARHDQRRPPPRAEPAPDAGRLRPRPEHQRDPARHDRARARLPDADPDARRRRADDERRDGDAIAGLIVDAGPVNSGALLRIENGSGRAPDDPNDPTTLTDVFFRIGGAEAGKRDQEPRGQRRLRHPRRHLGLAGRPRQRRRLDEQHRRHRRGRERRQRDRLRPVRRALPEGRDALERPRRDGSSSSRTRCRTTRRARRRGWSRRPSSAIPRSRSRTRCRASAATGWGATASSTRAWTFSPPTRSRCPETLPAGSLHDLLTIFLDATNGKGGILNVVNNTGGSSTKANPDVPVTVASYP